MKSKIKSNNKRLTVYLDEVGNDYIEFDLTVDNKVIGWGFDTSDNVNGIVKEKLIRMSEWENLHWFKKYFIYLNNPITYLNK